MTKSKRKFFLDLLAKEASARTLLCAYMIILFSCTVLYLQSYPHVACIS